MTHLRHDHVVWMLKLHAIHEAGRPKLGRRHQDGADEKHVGVRPRRLLAAYGALRPKEEIHQVAVDRKHLRDCSIYVGGHEEDGVTSLLRCRSSSPLPLGPSLRSLAASPRLGLRFGRRGLVVLIIGCVILVVLAAFSIIIQQSHIGVCVGCWAGRGYCVQVPAHINLVSQQRDKACSGPGGVMDCAQAWVRKAAMCEHQFGVCAFWANCATANSASRECDSMQWDT